MSYDSFVPSQNLDQCTPIHLNLMVSLYLMFLLVLFLLVVPMQIGFSVAIFFGCNYMEAFHCLHFIGKWYV